MTATRSGIERYFEEDALTAFEADFSFLIAMIADSCGEYDLQLRKGYVNVYYKGNSIAKISPRLAAGEYEFSVHYKFQLPAAVEALNDPRLPASLFGRCGDYDVARVPRKHVHPFFQKKVVDKLAAKIKSVNYGEEIAFEQSLITDNLGRSDFLVIDRQVTGGGIAGRLDLLALRLVSESTYCLVLLEVKLGNNPELSGDVAGQLARYVAAIQANIAAFKGCYEKNYAQKRRLGLIGGSSWDNEMPESISIDDKVEGLILVGFYSGIGRRQVNTLLETHPELHGCVQCFWNIIPSIEG